MTSLARLIVRVTVGGLLAGHGAQKLFGSFGGPGVKGTAGWLESMSLKPGRQWAIVAGMSEFGGGLLTALGALNPIGPIMAASAMLMATLKVHRGKPVWSTAGGAELPLTNLAILGGLFLAGPGKLSFDGLLGIRVPRWFSVTALLAMVGVTWAVASASELEAMSEGAQEDELEAGAELQAGDAERMSGESETAGGAGGSNATPGTESWGSPDDGEVPTAAGDGEDAGAIAAMRPDEDA
jgi:putative oxidoreductase